MLKNGIRGKRVSLSLRFLNKGPEEPIEKEKITITIKTLPLPCRYTFTFCLIAILLQPDFARAAVDSFHLHTDLPEINKDDQLSLNIFYSSESLFKAALEVSIYQLSNVGDSVLVAHKLKEHATFKRGVNKLKFIFSASDSNTSYSNNFYEILKRTGSIPPGSYKINLVVKRDSDVSVTTYLHDVDSLLPPSSPVRQDVNSSLSTKHRSFFGKKIAGISKKQAKSITAEKAFANAKGKVDRTAKKRGLTTEHYDKNGKSYIDFFYNDWFAGRYEVKNTEPLSTQIATQDKLAGATSINTGAGHPSLFSQYKKSNKEKKEGDSKGEIGFTTNLSSGQEQYSGTDNNYYELRGRLEMPVGGIPIEVEGLYTSQDNHRQIKSSYFKIHYDVQKMKEGLQSSTNSYNKQFAETKSRGAGTQRIYQSSINNLEGQKSKLQKELEKQATGDVGDNKQKNLLKDIEGEASDTAGLTNNVSSPDSFANNSSDSSAKKRKGNVDQLNNKSKEEKASIEKKQKQIEELDKRIQKYKTLLAQSENTNRFDSLLGYSKTKDVDGGNMTYKQMAKKSTNLLPDGKAKGFVSGITSMDAGMFNKEESKYTMSGQMVKGIDFGYDLGICQEEVTVGKTEYVGRDGSLDRYTCYSERTTFVPAKKQKLALVYYGYTPDQSMFAKDAFFKNMNIATPGFSQPVHIVSTNYDGQVSKYIIVGGEAAMSMKNSDNSVEPRVAIADKIAYNLHGEGNIPRTAVSIQAMYDKTGKAFENNTLPVNMSGTEQFTLTGQNDFFHSRLTAKVEYDRLTQANFATKGTNTKWGFDVNTSFRRYPNVGISYKPFTTFRSFTDTLNIPQRTMFGSVWTGRVTYQIKKHGRSVRFLLLYNNSSTAMDSSNYGSSLMQASTIYTDKRIAASVSVGRTQMMGATIVTTLNPVTTPNKMSFLSMTGNYALTKQWGINAGQDFGVADFGLCRYSVNGGFICKPDKIPVTVRMNLRFSRYQLTSGEAWKQLYSGTIDVLYRFKMKKEKPSSH